MKAKQIQIGIRSEGDIFDDFIAAAEALERGENVREVHGVYFTSLEAFRKAVTPKRLALLHLIRTARPASCSLGDAETCRSGGIFSQFAIPGFCYSRFGRVETYL